ncbi:MAG: hypothetical protein IPG55_08585 [Saprospiraceae bacterium]|nr:hypothetical protein [Candidatus Defluviibacterium haderslevense]
MSKHWKEKTDPTKHVDFMSSTHLGGIGIEGSKEKGAWVYFVRECSFTFQFASLRQLKVASDYFSKTVHPSTRRKHDGLEHYWQFWYEKLPKGLIGGSKREKVHKALTKALMEFEQG